MKPTELIHIFLYSNAPMPQQAEIIEVSDKAIKVKFTEHAMSYGDRTIWIPKKALKKMSIATDSYLLQLWFKKKVTNYQAKILGLIG